MLTLPVFDYVQGKPATPFLLSHYIAWGSIVAASGVGILTGASANLALPFMLGITVIGYILGNSVPSKFQVCE